MLVERSKASGGGLDTNRAFTALSLFALLQEPLTSIVAALSSLMGSVGCFTRIQTFLLTESRVDGRSVENANSGDGSWRSTSTQSVQEKAGSPTHEKSRSPNRQVVKSTEDLKHSHAVVVKDGAFSYDASKEPNLSAINIEIPIGKFTLVVGPVGSGKSTLLKAILGEVTIVHGSVYVSSPEIAYCDQTPWHMNGTVRDSVIAFSGLDEAWYQQVLEACALKQDLKQLPKGDLTQIGSKGIVLSGGQSQRIVSFDGAFTKPTHHTHLPTPICRMLTIF